MLSSWIFLSYLLYSISNQKLSKHCAASGYSDFREELIIISLLFFWMFYFTLFNRFLAKFRRGCCSDCCFEPKFWLKRLVMKIRKCLRKSSYSYKHVKKKNTGKGLNAKCNICLAPLAYKIRYTRKYFWRNYGEGFIHVSIYLSRCMPRSYTSAICFKTLTIHRTLWEIRIQFLNT